VGRKVGGRKGLGEAGRNAGTETSRGFKLGHKCSRKGLSLIKKRGGKFNKRLQRSLGDRSERISGAARRLQRKGCVR